MNPGVVHEYYTYFLINKHLKKQLKLMKGLKGLNLLKPVLSNSEMRKGIMPKRKDSDYDFLRVDCTNDTQMVNAELRLRKLDLDRSYVGKDKEILKKVSKKVTDLREEFIAAIVGCKHPKSNIVFIPMKG